MPTLCKVQTVDVEFFYKLRDEFEAIACILTQQSEANGVLTSQVLTNHSRFVETMITCADPASCESHIHSTGRELAITSLSSHSPAFSNPFMKAEKLEAYLGTPVFDGDTCVGALQIMHQCNRIWSMAEREKLSLFALEIQQHDHSQAITLTYPTELWRSQTVQSRVSGSRAT